MKYRKVKIPKKKKEISFWIRILLLYVGSYFTYYGILLFSFFSKQLVEGEFTIFTIFFLYLGGVVIIFLGLSCFLVGLIHLLDELIIWKK